MVLRLQVEWSLGHPVTKEEWIVSLESVWNVVAGISEARAKDSVPHVTPIPIRPALILEAP